MDNGESSSEKGKRPRIFNEKEEVIVSSDEEQMLDKNSNPPKKQKVQYKNVCTRPFSEIWEYYEKGTQKNNGHYEAICTYCKTKWSRGKPQKMEAHLTNECLP